MLPSPTPPTQPPIVSPTCKLTTREQTFAELFKQLPYDVQAQIFIPQDPHTVKEQLMDTTSLLRTGLDVLKANANAQGTLVQTIKTHLRKQFLDRTASHLFNFFNTLAEPHTHIYHPGLIPWFTTYIRFYLNILIHTDLTTQDDIIYLQCTDTEIMKIISFIQDAYTTPDDSITSFPGTLTFAVSPTWRMTGFKATCECKSSQLHMRFVEDLDRHIGRDPTLRPFRKPPAKDPVFAQNDYIPYAAFCTMLQDQIQTFQVGSGSRPHLHGFSKRQIMGLQRYVTRVLKSSRKHALKASLASSSVPIK